MKTFLFTQAGLYLNIMNDSRVEWLKPQDIKLDFGFNWISSTIRPSNSLLIFEMYISLQSYSFTLNFINSISQKEPRLIQCFKW